jgi:hypothetical protein
MRAEHHIATPVTSETRLPFMAWVKPKDEGWVTTIDLGVGAVLSRWFEDEQQARAFPLEFAAWLQRHAE